LIFIILASEKTQRLRQWQEQGHEISFHHHSLIHSSDLGRESNAINLDVSRHISFISLPFNYVVIVFASLFSPHGAYFLY
jgi:hypothetical protein